MSWLPHLLLLRQPWADKKAYLLSSPPAPTSWNQPTTNLPPSPEFVLPDHHQLFGHEAVVAKK